MTAAEFLGGARQRVSTQWGQSVYRAGYLLAASSVITAVVGAGFWLLAARLYTPAVIGLNSASISAMMFLAGVAQLNLMSALLRFVPTAGGGARRMVLGSYIVGVGLSALSAVVFLAGLSTWAPDLATMLGPWPVGLSFVLACAMWAVFVLQPSALVAVGQTAAAAVANQVFNIAKVALLVALTVLLPGTGVWFAWTAAALVATVGGTWFLFARAIPAFAAASHFPAQVASPREMVRFIAPDYLASLAWIASTSLVPILVLNLTDPEHAAVFALAWSVCFVLYGVAAAFGQSLVAHGPQEPSRLEERHRTILVNTLSLLAPAVVVLVVFAPILLVPFGPWYAGQGANTVRLLALSSLPNTVVALTVSRARVTRQMSTVVTTMLALAVIVLSLTWLLVPRIGIAGGGVAWLVGQTVVAAGIGGRRVSGSLVRSPHSGVPARVRQQALGRVAAGGWRVERTVRTVSDTAVVLLSSPAGSAVLKIARADLGAAALLREQDILRRLWSEERLGRWRTMLPEVLDQGRVRDGTYLLLSRLPGAETPTVTRARGSDVTAAALAAITPLHRLVSHPVTVDSSLLQQWVDEPAARIAQALPGRGPYRAALEELTALLHQELSDRVLTLGWTHGDFHPGNVLVDPGGEVRGIIDWEGAHDRDLPVLDLVHWLLTTPVGRVRRELGGQIADRLAAKQCLSAAEASLVSSVPGGTDVPPQVLLLLGWTRHVGANIAKSERYTASPIWVRRNVLPVLRWVGHG